MMKTKTLRSRYLKYLALAALVCIAMLARTAWSWSADSMINTPISTATRSQLTPLIIGDGAGGAIISWKDFRNYRADIYAQRVDAKGKVLWTTNGVIVAATRAADYQITTDGAGGAIIAWYETRDQVYWNVYAQRVNADGAVQWATNGQVIAAVAGSIQSNPAIIADGLGGAIISWSDERNGDPDWDIYAQRINASGVVQWAENGVAISTATSSQLSPKIISDAGGGAIISWEDNRNGSFVDIYAQRINTEGVVQWPTNGIAISVTDSNKLYHQMTADGSSGAIISWGDTRNHSVTEWDIYAQRVNASGVVQWTTNGMPICNATNNQYLSQIASDGMGGAIISWEDRRNGSTNGSTDDIYAQHIDAGGAALWVENGMFVVATGSYQANFRMTANNAGGAIMTWMDERDGPKFNLYAQSINNEGAAVWAVNGVVVTNATGQQIQPSIVADGNGNSIITWIDKRNPVSLPENIYAQQLSASGELGKLQVATDDYFCLPVRALNGNIAVLCL